MKIGELSQRCGVAASTIRFYESKGLLESIPRKSNGYRDYPDEAVFLLTLILSAQQTGFSLDEIAQMLPPNLENWDHDKLISALQQKITDIEKLEHQLQQNKSCLKEVIQAIQEKPEDMNCAENAQRLMKELTQKLASHVTRT